MCRTFLVKESMAVKKEDLVLVVLFTLQVQRLLAHKTHCSAKAGLNRTWIAYFFLSIEDMQKSMSLILWFVLFDNLN